MSAFLKALEQNRLILIILAVELFLLCLFPPNLIFDPSLITGGDTASHYPTAEVLRQRLFAGESLFTWDHGNYAGFPLFLNYFPLPFVLMALFSLAIPLQIAFKLVTLLAVIPLPLAVYGCLRRLRYRDPIPVLGSAFSLLFLLMTENSMWGGNIASTLAGEFSYGIALCLSVYLIGKLHDDIGRGRRLLQNALLESLVALCSGYPLLQVGFGSSYFLFRRRFIPYILALHAFAFCFMGFWLLPLLRNLPWDTPFNYSWNIQDWREVIPPSFLPALLGIPLGWIVRILRRHAEDDDPARHADRYLWWQTGIALVGFAVGPVVGLVDIRFLPVAQLMLLLLGASGWGRVFASVGRHHILSAVTTAGIMIWGAFHLGPIPGWVQWNYGGVESKTLWQSFKQVNDSLRGTADDPRVVYEHSEVHNGAGTVRAFEMLPFFSGRSTLEGLYMQSSITSPFVFYIQSELCHAPSSPFSLYYYSGFDPERAAEHLRLFNTNRIVAATDEACEALDRSPDFGFETSFAPYRIYRLQDSSDSYAVPLRYRPYRIPRQNWKQVQFEWFRLSSLDVPLIVDFDHPEAGYCARLPIWEGDPRSMPKDEIYDPAAGEIRTQTSLGDNEIVVETSRVGHPLWIKISYHPDWKIAEGRGELYLASPSFMLLVPETSRVVLRFDTHSGIYAKGKFLTLLSWLMAAAALLFGRITGRGSFPFAHSETIPPPSIHPAVWFALGLTILSAAYGRNERDPLLLYDSALKVYQEADAATQPGTPEADPSAKAVRNARWAEVQTLFAHCLEKFPNSPVADHSVHYLAQSLMKQEKWQEAVDVLFSFMETHPDSRINAEILYHLGVAFRSLHEDELSTDYFRQVLDRFPESPWSLHAASGLLQVTPPEQLFELAMEHFHKEDYLRAAPILDILSDQPALAVSEDSARYFAYAQFYRNRWEEAAKLFTAWVEAHPENPKAVEVWFTLGECHMFLAHYPEALQALQNALRIDPELADTQPFRAVFTLLEDMVADGR